jgi:RNA polymerase-binding transcription factor DksA
MIYIQKDIRTEKREKMICKRCEQRIPDNTRNRAPYCRHCYSAIQHKKALDKINNLWDKVTNNG